MLRKKIFNVPVVSLVSQPAVAVSTIAVLLLLSVEVAMKAAVVFEVDFVALRTQLLLAEVEMPADLVMLLLPRSVEVGMPAVVL